VIIRREADRVLGVTQTAHSALTGRLAEAWPARDDLPWDELCTAAAIHDLGWAQWELAPQINPQTGLPYAFYEMPAEPYEQIWARGTDEARTYGRLVGLLVSRHFTRLAGRREALADLIARERAHQAEATAGLGLDAATLDACTELLARWDGISLDLCGGKATDAPELAGFTAPVDARELPDGPVVTLKVGMAGGGSGHPHVLR
jgi:Protein of unknown function (DUF3891)